MADAISEISSSVNILRINTEIVGGIIVSSSSSPYPKPEFPVCQELALNSGSFHSDGSSDCGKIYCHESPLSIIVCH